jgi:AraC-like DNA-binding protein
LVDFATMLQGPIGCYTRHGPFLAWVSNPQLCGITYVGRVGDEHLPLLRSSATLPFHPDLERPYRAVIDCSQLRDIGPGVFAFLVEHICDMERQRMLSRLAVIRPTGLTGAASTGLVYEHFNGRIDVSFRDDMPAALAYLEAAPSEAAVITTALDEALAAPALLERLRQALADDPGIGVSTAAHRLGMTRRALQRALHHGQTSFRAEAAGGRFAHALRLLTISEEKIEVIAREAGYASALNFSRRVRQLYNMTPSELRETLRRSPRAP